jgi:hypothetical protein
VAFQPQQDLSAWEELTLCLGSFQIVRGIAVGQYKSAWIAMLLEKKTREAVGSDGSPNLPSVF